MEGAGYSAGSGWAWLQGDVWPGATYDWPGLALWTAMATETAMPVAAVRVAPVVAPATVATVAAALRRIEGGAAVSGRRVAAMIAVFGSLVAGASNGAVSGPPQVEQARKEGEKKKREKRREERYEERGCDKNTPGPTQNTAIGF